MPALAQDPVVTRTGVHKILAPPNARCTGQGLDPVCRYISGDQTIVIYPNVPITQGLAAAVTVMITYSRRGKTRWLLRKPPV